MTDDELDRAFALDEGDRALREAILLERLRRLTSVKPAARTGWLQPAILLVALLGAILAGIAAYPVIDGLFDREWFDL